MGLLNQQVQETSYDKSHQQSSTWTNDEDASWGGMFLRCIGSDLSTTPKMLVGTGSRWAWVLSNVLQLMCVGRVELGHVMSVLEMAKQWQQALALLRAAPVSVWTPDTLCRNAGLAGGE